MIAFTYDSTFEGLLCAVFDAYTQRIFPDALVGINEIPPLIASRVHAVSTEEAHFERVYQGLKKRLSPRGMQQLKYAWLSEEAGAGMAAFRYIRKVFDARAPVEGDLADPDIFAIIKLARKVAKDAHLLLGFVRFQKTADGKYAATISPKHNILPLLLRHFASRFAEQQWIIFDMGRQYGVMHDGLGFHDVYLDNGQIADLVKNIGRLPVGELAADELLVQDLWKTYFASVSIKERENPRQQRRCMPRRFWDFLTEKQY